MCKGPEDKKGMVHGRNQRVGCRSRDRTRRSKDELHREGSGDWLQGSEVIWRAPSSKSAFKGPPRKQQVPLSLHGWCCWASSLSTLGSLLAMQHLRPTQTH